MELIKECKRCGYVWEARSMKQPKQCPGCKRTDWNSELKVVRNPAYNNRKDEPVNENQTIKYKPKITLE